MKKPFVLAIGGTTRAGSSTECALALALSALREKGVETGLLAAEDLDLPAYSPHMQPIPAKATRLVEAVKRADAIILGTPGYHGGISGLVKNALDYVEELRTDARPYFDGRAVGCIVTAGGEQGAAATLQALRSVVHALRGWPTPFGVTIITSSQVFDKAGQCVADKIESQIRIMADQIFDFVSATPVAT